MIGVVLVCSAMGVVLVFPEMTGVMFVLIEETKSQLNATYYFIVLLIGSTCFEHYYAHHQELATIMLITNLVV